MRFLALSIVAVLISQGHAQARQPVRPLIFIPGVTGSKLCKIVNGEKHVVWGKTLQKEVKEAHKLQMHLSGDGIDGIEPCGIIESIDGCLDFGALGCWSLFRISMYSTLMKGLASFGYCDALRNERDEDHPYLKPCTTEEQKTRGLYIFSYDWRKSNFFNANELSKFVGKRLPEDVQEYDILAHSMGGIVGNIFLRSRLKNHDRARKFVTMSTPHKGSVEHVKRVKYGFRGLPSDFLERYRKAALSFPSFYEMLPTYENCCTTSVGGFFKATNVAQWDKLVELPDIFRERAGQEFLEAMLSNRVKLDELLSKTRLPDNVYFYPMSSDSHQGPREMKVKCSDDGLCSIEDFRPGYGDGAVLVGSARGYRIDAKRRFPFDSLGSHNDLWALGKGQRKLKKALLGSDGEPVAAVSSLSVRVKDAKGQDVKIAAVDLSVSPVEQRAKFKHEYRPRESLSIEITLCVLVKKIFAAAYSFDPSRWVQLDPQIELAGAKGKWKQFEAPLACEKSAVSFAYRAIGIVSSATKPGIYAVKATIPVTTNDGDIPNPLLELEEYFRVAARKRNPT